METKKKWTARILAGILIVCMMLTTMPALPEGGTVEAATAKAVTVKAKAMYSYAYQVLKLINKERKSRGLSTLVMDMDLMEGAMQRAAENVVSIAATGNISHSRPDGSQCFTVSSKSYAENLACGQRTAAAVVDAWMKSTMGHKENILNSAYTCVGVGCVQVGDIMYLYWAQEFGRTSSPKKGTQPKDKSKTYTVSLTASMYKTVMAASDYSSIIKAAKTTAKTTTKTGWIHDSKGWWYRYTNGSYPKKQWKKISGAWYYFKADGYMATGWLKLGKKRYYLKANGVMKTGWLKLSGKWYYFKQDGSMITGAATIKNKIYRFNNSGVCLNP